MPRKHLFFNSKVFRDNPDVLHFESSIRSVISLNIFKSSNLCNCENDDDDILATVYQPTIEEKICNDDLIDFADASISDSGMNLNSFSIIEDNMLVYVAGYLAHKLLKRNDCIQCKSLLLLSEKNLEPNRLFIYFKEYSYDKDCKGLKSPTIEFINTVKD